MNSNQSQNQRQQQPGQQSQAAPGQHGADAGRDPIPSQAQQGQDGAVTGQGDSNRTPRQEPVGQPPRQQQGDAIAREQQQQEGSPSEDTDDAGDTRPHSDDRHSSGNN